MKDVFNVGDQARLVQPVVVGAVADIRYNKDAAELELLLDYQDADGTAHQRWFLATQLESAQ